MAKSLILILELQLLKDGIPGINAVIVMFMGLGFLVSERGL